MTVSEKSEELIKKYSPLVTTWDCYWDVPQKEELIIADAKKCAIICVEQILEELDQLRKPEYTTFVTNYDTHEQMDGYEKMTYYREVLEHLKNS